MAKERHEFYPPFIVIPLPIDKDGRGPEMDDTKVVRTVYQVWDSCCETVSSHKTESAARKAHSQITKSYRK